MAMAVRWNDNLFTDLSGSILQHRKPGFLSELYWWEAADGFYKGGALGPFDKIVFGSDTGPDKIAAVVRDYERHFDGIGLSPDNRRKIWWDNAAAILGLA